MIEFEYLYVNGELEKCRIRKRVKYGKWNDYEDNLLRKNYACMTVNALADMLARSVKSIEARLLRLKLKKIPNWQPEEIAELQNGCHNLKRSKAAIRVMRCRLKNNIR